MSASPAVGKVPVRLTGGTAMALAAGVCVGYLAGGMLPEVVAAFRNDAGMSTTQAGVVATTILLATAVAGLVCSGIASRPGRHRLAMLGAAVAAAGYVCAAFMSGIVVLSLSAAVAGFGSGMALAAATAALGAMPDPDRASGITLLVNAMLGAGLLAITPQLTGGRQTGVLLVMAALCLIGLPFMRRLPDAGARAQRSGLPHLAVGAVLLAGAASFKIAETGLWAFIDDYGETVIGLDGATVGLILAASAVGGLLGAGMQISLGDRFGRLIPVAATLVIDLVCRAVLLGSTSVKVYTAANVVWMGCFVALMAYVLAIAAAMDPVGRWAAITAATLAFGDAFGPVVIGSVVDGHGYGRLVPVSVALGLVTLVCLTVAAGVVDRWARSGATEPAGSPLNERGDQPSAV